jgi:predicted dehydrogenase
MDLNFYNVYLNVALFGRPERAAYYPNIFPGLADTSGIMILQYDGFVSQNSGAKDTWGVNSFQIEGEKGYIYIENGANGIAAGRTVTKNSEEIWNAQDNPDRWYYEIQELTRLFRNDCYEEIYERLDITLGTVDVIEHARKAAGILFAGEDSEGTPT